MSAFSILIIMSVLIVLFFSIFFIGNIGMYGTGWILILIIILGYVFFIVSLACYLNANYINNQKLKSTNNNSRKFIKAPQTIKEVKPKNRFCSKCWTEFAKDGLFCHNCGKPKHTEVRFCAYCGTYQLKKAIFCHKCGNILKSQIKY